MPRSARVAVGILILSAAAAADQYVISTYAGGAPPPTPAPAADIPIVPPLHIATDAAGNLYFTSRGCVFKLDRDGIVTRVAGNSRWGYSGDGGPATNAQLQLGSVGLGADGPGGLAVDAAGNLFIADFDRIRRVSPSGIITTVAGGGTEGLGDGGPATSANLDMGFPWALAVDGAGNLFIVDRNRIRKVSTNGIITTVAGDGSYGFSGDGGPATGAQLNGAIGVAVDGAGNLFIADFHNYRIRKVSPSGIITTVAGDGSYGPSGDGGPATGAQLGFPWGVAVDEAGSLFIADGGERFGGYRIRKVSITGTITTVAGGGTLVGSSADGGPATDAAMTLGGVAVDGAGNLFIADSANPGFPTIGLNRIRKVSPSGIISTVAANNTCCYSGDGGPATRAQLTSPNSVAVDGGGNLFIADSDIRIRKVSPNGTITTVAGNGKFDFSGDGGPATSAQLSVSGLAVDGEGNVFIADKFNNRIRKVSPSGIITTVAGNGSSGFSGDGGPATSAMLAQPAGVAVDGAGALFIADYINNRIRKVSPSGIITTVAGNGTFGFSGDGGPATDATLAAYGVAVDRAGNLFIVDDNRIRKVSTSGIITTVAVAGPAMFAGPLASVAVDGVGNVFFVDNNRIRKLPPGGIITTVAGNGTFGFSGDGGPATNAAFGYLAGVALDGAGNLYVSERGNDTVRILRPTSQSVLIGAVMDAASQSAMPVSPGKIVVIYGAGFSGPDPPDSRANNGQFGAEVAGTTVSLNGIAAPILYASATQVAAIVPYAVTGATAQVTVSYKGQVSAAFTVPVAASAPSLFTVNGTGAGQAAAINVVDGTVNTAANPVKIGGYISLYATGEGQTSPAGLDGKLAGATPARPTLPVSVIVGGIPATVQYAGSAPGQVAGLMQVNLQIPDGVQPGGYVPVVVQVGDRSSSPAVWIAVAEN